MFLHLNPIGGISGDMFIGALLDLGVDIDFLRRELKKIQLGGYTIGLRRVKRAGIIANKFDVTVTAEKNLSLNSIRSLISGAKFPEEIKDTCFKIYKRLEQAERKAHGIRTKDVTFEQLGEIDSIIDIAACAICLNKLKITKIVCAPLPISWRTGTAASELLKGRRVRFVEYDYETVTPTGAAIVSALASEKQTGQEDLKVSGLGYGAGDFNPKEHENVLRATLCLPDPASAKPEVVCVETNIDDANPQIYGHLFELLLANGAKDVFTTPVQMKKNRPAVLLTVIAKPDDLTRICEVIFRETPTLGIRYHFEQRDELNRKTIKAPTSMGQIRFKIAKRDDCIINVSPEYEDCKKIAEQKRVSLRTVLLKAQMEAEKIISTSKIRSAPWDYQD